MRCIVRHPLWGFFLGTLPGKEDILVWSNSTRGFRCSVVITFQGSDQVTDFFINRPLSMEDLGMLEICDCPIDKPHLNLGDLKELGFIGKDTAGLLYNEPPMGYC